MNFFSLNKLWNILNSYFNSGSHFIQKIATFKKKISVLLKFKGVTGLRYSLVPPSLGKNFRTAALKKYD